MEPYEDVMQALEPKPRGGKGPVIAVIAVVAAICVAGGALAMNLMNASPEKAVTNAVAATFEQAEKKLEALQKTYPAIGASQTFSSGKARLGYHIGFAGIEGVDYANMISALLTGSSLDLAVAQDIDAKTIDMEMALTFLKQPFLEGRYFLSPDMIALSVPSLSDTAVSVRLESFARDYPSSPLGRLYPLDAGQLALIERQMDAYRSQMRALDRQAAETLASGLKEIGSGLLEKAEYSSPEKGRYRVAVPGEAARQALIDTVRLCVAACYTDKMLDSMTGPYGGSMREYLEDFYAGLPPLDTTADLTIANKIITAAEITCAPTTWNEDAPAPDIWPLTLSYAFTRESRQHSLALAFAGEDAKVFSMRMDYTDSEADGRYREHLTVTAESDAEPGMFDLVWDYSTGKDGSIEHDGTFSFLNQFSFGFAADGSVSQDGETWRMALPETRFSMSSPYMPQEAAVLLDLDITCGPLDGALTAPAAADLLSMSEAELFGLYDEWSDGLSELESRFYSLLLG